MPLVVRHGGGGRYVARNTPTIRAGVLILELSTDDKRTELAPESESWFRWLEAARTFAFEDAGGRFTARKKRRWGTEYWYAFRRGSGRLYETYLGRARDITLSRLHAAAVKLSQVVQTSGLRAELPEHLPPRQVAADSRREVAPAAGAGQSGGSRGQRREAALQRSIAKLLDAFTPPEQTRSPRHVGQPAGGATEPSAKLPEQRLTPRELEVLRLVAAGASTDDIARLLVIAASTARRHVSNIFAALDVHRRTQAVARARELGLLAADGSNETAVEKVLSPRVDPVE